jgi:hypothetical protein
MERIHLTYTRRVRNVLHTLADIDIIHILYVTNGKTHNINFWKLICDDSIKKKKRMVCGDIVFDFFLKKANFHFCTFPKIIACCCCPF